MSTNFWIPTTKGVDISTNQFVRMAAVKGLQKDYATVESSLFQVSLNFHEWQLLRPPA